MKHQVDRPTNYPLLIIVLLGIIGGWVIIPYLIGYLGFVWCVIASILWLWICGQVYAWLEK